MDIAVSTIGPKQAARQRISALSGGGVRKSPGVGHLNASLNRPVQFRDGVRKNRLRKRKLPNCNAGRLRAGQPAERCG